MIGRQTIATKNVFTLQELEQFMQQNWDKNEYNDFFIGRPTAASIEEYILLPATQRFMVIVYPRKHGLFSKDNKVILAVCDSPAGVKSRLINSIPSSNVFFGIYKISSTVTTEEERKGPAEDALQKYTAYMRSLLEKAGYLK